MINFFELLFEINIGIGCNKLVIDLFNIKSNFHSAQGIS